MIGLDFSWGRPGAKAIKDAGYEFVVRYVPYLGDGGKGLTKAEMDSYLDAGLSIAMVFESTAGRALEGSAAGGNDGLLAAAQLRLLGFSDDISVYFAVDIDTSPSQYPLLDRYLAGCAWGIDPDRIGVYGEYDVIEHCLTAGTATYGWQTYAWSGGRVSDKAHLYQYRNGQTLNGAAVDFNRALKEDFGQFPRKGSNALTDDEKLAIFAGSEEHVKGVLKSREERLRLANDRITEAAEGRAPSVRELAASASVAAPAGKFDTTALRKLADHLNQAAAEIRGLGVQA